METEERGSSLAEGREVLSTSALRAWLRLSQILRDETARHSEVHRMRTRGPPYGLEDQA